VGSLVLGTHCEYENRDVNNYNNDNRPYEIGYSEPDDTMRDNGVVSDYIEMWDYVGGIRFRGFVAHTQKEEEKAMFVFFDQSVVVGDLKAGLMALLELCEVDYFACDRLVVCIDRHAEVTGRDTLVKDLGWIGFSLTTLDDFSETGELTSEKWLFMDMET
jgi:hypothetical protein